MPNQFFKFKQFCIQQDKCAMKVGTDGTLLGAWANVAECKKVLDIGTGTGLIALMTAQRNKNAFIDAIDIDLDAAVQASENVANSPFSKQIRIHHTSLQLFAQKTTPATYDLILSNPPYFSASLKCPEKRRSMARHNDTLPLNELLYHSTLLLTAKGRISLILPFEKQEELINLANKNNLYTTRQTNIIPSLGKQPKRILIEFSCQKKPFNMEELIIEKSRHQYTEAYQKLTQDFYL